MISHVYIGIGDFERAFAFYDALARSLGLHLRFCERDTHSAGWQSAAGGRPLLVIAPPYDGRPHHPGNGQMTALLAASRQAVRDAWQAALAHGGKDEGAPGLRPHYHPHYYGAYLRDPDGNKLCVACHEQE